jgi:hypothetical protein
MPIVTIGIDPSLGAQEAAMLSSIVIDIWLSAPSNWPHITFFADR